MLERYEVSNLGRVRTLPYIDGRGFNRPLRILKYSDAQISLMGKCYPVAALILRAFIGLPPEGKYLARHLDDDRNNNNLNNLAWGNDQDNHNDAVRNGRSFVSLGNLGKPHTEETKRKIGLKSSRPTGRKMSEDHKKAIWEGYRKKFPEKVKRKKLCKCGCGRFTKPGNTFIHGHTGRNKNNGKS